MMGLAGVVGGTSGAFSRMYRWLVDGPVALPIRQLCCSSGRRTQAVGANRRSAGTAHPFHPRALLSPSANDEYVTRDALARSPESMLVRYGGPNASGVSMWCRWCRYGRHPLMAIVSLVPGEPCRIAQLSPGGDETAMVDEHHRSLGPCRVTACDWDGRPEVRARLQGGRGVGLWDPVGGFRERIGALRLRKVV